MDAVRALPSCRCRSSFSKERKSTLRPSTIAHSSRLPRVNGPPSNRQAGLSRRKFMLASGVAAAAFTIVPRHVLGGPGFVPPSEKVTLAYIGCGTQGLREMVGMLAMPEIQIVAVCDPVKEGYNYVDWSKDGLRSSSAQALGQPDSQR